MADGWCKGTVTGAHHADRDGNCTWCGQRVEAPLPAPTRYPQAQDSLWWRLYNDPDFGTEDTDMQP